MKTLTISNIPDVMYQHMVNGFAGDGTAFQTLSQEQQQTLVRDKILDFCTGVAKAHAVNMAQLAATRQTETLANMLIQQTKAVVEVAIEESGTSSP